MKTQRKKLNPFIMVVMITVICLTGILSGVSAQNIKKDDTIKAYTENMPPYNFKKDGKITGFSVELLHAIVKQAGVKISLRLGPWKRFYIMVEETPNTLLFTATRNEDREDRFKWVGPINNRTIKLWRLVNPVKDWKMSINRSSNEAALRSIKEGQYMIGATDGDASHKKLKDQGYKIFSATMPGLSFKQFLAGRFPIYSGMDLATAVRLRNEGRSFSDIKEVAVFDDQYSYYYILNKDTDCNVIYRLQKALDILKYNGVYKSIKNKWMQ